MSHNYDNWERLVSATLRRESLRELALMDSSSYSDDESSDLSHSISRCSSVHEALPFSSSNSDCVNCQFVYRSFQLGNEEIPFGTTPRVNGINHTSGEAQMPIGPWAGAGGKLWSFKPEKGITEIVIAHGSIIDCIFLDNVQKEGHQYLYFGGDGGRTIDKITLNHPWEYLTSINGTYDRFPNRRGPTVISSLSFCTNFRKFGVFGSDTGIPFSFSVDSGGSIIGFHGRSGRYLDAIGVYAKSVCLCCVPNPVDLYANNQEKNLIVGPWGGIRGKIWNFKPKDGIAKLIVEYGTVINSLVLFEHGPRGSFEKFGGHGDGGVRTDEVIIEYPDEYLTAISGTYDGFPNIHGSVIVLSLSFRTNLNQLRVFGLDKGTPFSFSVDDGMNIVGFHGRHSGRHLNAIGVYAGPLQLSPPIN